MRKSQSISTAIAFTSMLFLVAGVMLIASAAPALASERFTDHGDGTVTDEETGLTWLKDAGALGAMSWSEAGQRAAALSADDFDWLTDTSSAGDWRLPNHHEMRTLTTGYALGNALPADHPFRGVQQAHYWTSSAGYDPQRAWSIQPAARGDAQFEDIAEAKYVWPVRGEPRITHLGPAELHDDYDQLTTREKRRAERNALWDFQHLRRQREFIVERTEAFLEMPEDYPVEEFEHYAGFSVAEVAPTVRMQILPNLEPEYFPEGEAYAAGWANWAKVTRSDDGRFFMAASDHRARGSRINLYEYRPDEGEQGVLERALDVTEALGWHDDMFTDGKIHGHMGIMPDGTLWAATHRGPAPTDEWWTSGYRGAWLLSYNIHTGKYRNHGNPLIGQELPSHVLDPERGIFFATDHLDTTVLSYDVNENRVRYAGSPPNGWRWHARSTFLDPDTGHFWGVDRSGDVPHFMSFDPELNRFKRHDVAVPEHPITSRRHQNRLHTTPRAKDGWQYNMLRSTFIRFQPDWDDGPEVEVIGHAGGDSIQTALCPEGRYVYWIPRRGDTAVIKQYDIRTGEIKALGFIKDHIWRHYGYTFGNGVYGLAISECGSFLVALDNGGFGSRFDGHPALFVIDIPEQERPLD